MFINKCSLAMLSNRKNRECSINKVVTDDGEEFYIFLVKKNKTKIKLNIPLTGKNHLICMNIV